MQISLKWYFLAKLKSASEHQTTHRLVAYLRLLPLVYVVWCQKSESSLAPYSHIGCGVEWQWATILLWQPYCTTMQPRASEVHQDKEQSKVSCCCLLEWHIQGHWWVFTLVHGSKGAYVVPHLPCTCQQVSFRGTLLLFSTLAALCTWCYENLAVYLILTCTLLLTMKTQSVRFYVF